MGADKESSEIVGTILTLASKLEMDVIAEGVETEGQLTQLEASGCEFGQGYFFSEPRDARTIDALLEMNFPTRPDAFYPGPHFFQEDETLSSDLSM
jgi:EAL domain-containing protein (putative c-di-GMP-specific phosphodiesterase class I)